MKKIILFLALFLPCGGIIAQPQEDITGNQARLCEEIAAVVAGKRAVVGVSVIDGCGNTVVGVNDSLALPMLSVFKFPCALAVLDKMYRENIPLDSCLYVSKAQLPSGTYSPLRERYPEGGVSLSLSQLLAYSLSLSDNNACDILIEWVGGVETVQAYMVRHGFHDIKICADEADMHATTGAQGLNVAKPRDVARLFYQCFATDWLPSSHRFVLESLLLQTETGRNKLPAGLPSTVSIGHKTGSSDRTAEGMKFADNDAGFVCLPTGDCYYIVVFVCDSYESDATNASIIATISSLVYEYMSDKVR